MENKTKEKMREAARINAIKANTRKITDRILRIDLKRLLEIRYNIKVAGIKFQGLCPFHSDEHVGSAYVYADSGRDYFVCKSPGCPANKRKGVIDFVMQQERVDFKTAKKILEGYLYLEKKDIYTVNKIEKDFNLIDAVYKTIKNSLILKKEDEHILKRQRRFFDTKDVRSWDNVRALSTCLKKFSKEELLTVPGFFEEEGVLRLMQATDRIAIFVKNKDNKIIAVQLRSILEDAENKYIMLSSKNNAANMGLGFVPGDENSKIALCEGYFKAQALAKLGYAVFYLQGIQTLNKNEEYIANAIVSTTRYTKNYLDFFLDSDISISVAKRDFVNKSTLNIYRQVITSLEEIEADKINIHLCITNKKEKGVDDCLVAFLDRRENFQFYQIDPFSKKLNGKTYRVMSDMLLDLDMLDKQERNLNTNFKAVKLNTINI